MGQSISNEREDDLLYFNGEFQVFIRESFHLDELERNQSEVLYENVSSSFDVDHWLDINLMTSAPTIRSLLAFLTNGKTRRETEREREREKEKETLLITGSSFHILLI